MPTVLVADDSIAVRKVAERLLTEAGLGVTLAANGEEVLAYLTKQRPDVVVSDVIMPDKSGYEVCAFVRGNATLAATPVLLISGIVNDEVTKQAESCRADGVLKKPFQGTSLKDRVLELIAKRQEPSPADAPRPTTRPTPATVEQAFPMADQQQARAGQDLVRLKEVEDQLRAERARSEDLGKRLTEAAEHLAHAKGAEAQLAAERQRVSDLEAKLIQSEHKAGRISELETALKAEQSEVGALKQEVEHSQKISGRVVELESALAVERAAAEQLVQQLANLEQVSIRTRDLEAKLVSAEQQEATLHRKIQDLEAELVTEQRKGTETIGQLQDLERVATRVPELEGLLTAERDGNGLLARRVLEAEQAAESATKQLEEMARKLSEIAGLASQLGNGRGKS